MIERKFSIFSLKFTSGNEFPVKSNLGSNRVFLHHGNPYLFFFLFWEDFMTVLFQYSLTVPVPRGLQCKNQTFTFLNKTFPCFCRKDRWNGGGFSHKRKMFENPCLTSPNPFGVVSSKKSIMYCLRVVYVIAGDRSRSWGFKGWWSQSYLVAPLLCNLFPQPCGTSVSSSSAIWKRKDSIRMDSKMSRAAFMVPVL